MCKKQVIQLFSIFILGQPGFVFGVYRKAKILSTGASG